MKKKKDSIENPITTTDHTAPYRLFDNENSFSKDLRKARSMKAVLIVIRGKHQGRQITLTTDNMVIGRADDAAISLKERTISKHHALITEENGHHYIEDLKSTNGIYINEKLVHEKVKLKKEDMITIGSHILKYVPAGELEIMYHGNLAEAAHMDKGTNVYNQNYMREALDAEFKRSQALHSRLSIIIFDIDHFKSINDRLGHAGGDYTLKEVASSIREEVLRESDTFGRFGGDEFLIILWNHSLKAAYRVAEQIRRHVEQHRFIHNDKGFKVTLSLGVASRCRKTPTVDALYQACDKGLYAAKEGGRNKVGLFVGNSEKICLAENVEFLQEPGHIRILDPKDKKAIVINEHTGAVLKKEGLPTNKKGAA